MRRQHADEMSQRMEELRTVGVSYEIKIHEYEELMDLKVQLDQEIATYRALLQGEETRWALFKAHCYCRLLVGFGQRR